MDMLVKYLWEETKKEVDEFKYGILFYTLEDKLVTGGHQGKNHHIT